jgi:sugar transferase (PEP-CTERM/EpsH1 system associated)
MPSQAVSAPAAAPETRARVQADRVVVAQVVRSLDTGGQEVLCARLVERLDSERYLPLVISLQGGGWLADRLREQGFAVECLGAPEGWNPRTVTRLAELLRSRDVRVVHCHNRKALMYGGLATLLAPQARLVYTKHGVSHWDGGPTALLGRYLMRRARAVVAVSDDIARGVTAGRWADGDVLHTILNGVDLQQFTPSPERWRTRAELGLSAGAPVIGTVARLSPEKDQATLLRAFAQVAPSCPEARLLIVGDGALRGSLEALAAELSIQDRTLFVGERTDIPRLLGAMDVFCLPSLTEGTSLTLLEAMATALPVVATAVGGTPEVVSDGRTGLLVPPSRPELVAKALGELLRRPELREQMGRTGRSVVAARYSMEAMIGRYTGLYEQILT